MWLNKTILLLLGTFLILTNSVTAQQSARDDILLIGVRGVFQLNKQNGDISLYQNDEAFNFARHRSFQISSKRRFLIHWDYDDPYDDKVVLADIEHDNIAEIQLEVPSDITLEFKAVDWMFGDSYAVIWAGYYATDPYMANPTPHMARGWLMDIRTHEIMAWSWDCKDVVLLDVSQRFGLRCAPHRQIESAQSLDPIILSEDGIQKDDGAYTILNTKPDFPKPTWEFSASLTEVVYNECYELMQCSMYLYSLETQHAKYLFQDNGTDFYHFYWSPNDEYIVMYGNSRFTLYSVDAEQILEFERQNDDNFEISFWDFAFRSNEAGFYLWLDTVHITSDNERVFVQYLREYVLSDGQISMENEWIIPIEYTPTWITDVSS